MLREQGDLRGARPLYERALAIAEKVFGADHSATNRGRCNFAFLLLASGNPAEAFALGNIALTAHMKVLGLNHRWTKDSARVMVEALGALGRKAEATVLAEHYGVAPIRSENEG